MADTVKMRALRLALQTARREYDGKVYPLAALADVIAYLTARIQSCKPARPGYDQLPMFAVVGLPNGKYHCQACGQDFGENMVSRLQSRRAYLTLHCPHCLTCWYSDNSQ